MGRRKITEEAEQEQEQEQPADDNEEDREQLTQRMPEDLLADVDEIKDRLGISRNAAINMLVERGLDDF